MIKCPRKPREVCGNSRGELIPSHGASRRRLGDKYRRFSFESHIVWNINDNIFQNLLQNFQKAPDFTFKI